MNVPFQLKVPVDLATELKGILERVREAHEAEVASFFKRAKLAGNAEGLAAEKARLDKQGKHLTIHNLLRVILRSGYEPLKGISSEKLIAKMVDGGVARGRPCGS